MTCAVSGSGMKVSRTMSFEQIEKFVQDVQSNPELAARMEGGDLAKGLELARELGYDFTQEEAEEYLKKLGF